MTEQPYRTIPVRPRTPESVRPAAPPRSWWSLVASAIIALDLAILVVLVALALAIALSGIH